MRFLKSLFDAIVERSPEELIGALLIATAIAIVMAGLYALGRRKSSPSPSFVGGLLLFTGSLCMALTAGYIEYAETDWNSESVTSQPGPARWLPGGPRPATPPPWAFPGAGWSSGYHVIVAADENHDGLLTKDEAASLVQKADSDGDGSVDFHEIDRLIVNRIRPPVVPSRPTATGPNDHERGADKRADDVGSASSSGDVDRPTKPDE